MHAGGAPAPALPRWGRGIVWLPFFKGGYRAIRGVSISSNTIEEKKMADEYLVTKRPSRPPTHPGEIFRDDVLPSLKLSVSEAARRLGISRQSLHRIMAGTQPVTPEMAVRLGKFCGNGPRLWLAMQQEHDLWFAERQMADKMDSIETESPV
jgi:addiction module HigA family antidote